MTQTRIGKILASKASTQNIDESLTKSVVDEGQGMGCKVTSVAGKTVVKLDENCSDSQRKMISEKLSKGGFVFSEGRKQFAIEDASEAEVAECLK